MTNQITSDTIESTNAFKKLEGFQKKLLIGRSNRAVLEQALIHYKKTGEILQNIGSSNIKILTEISENYDKRHQTTRD